MSVYFQICDLVKSADWTVVKDDQLRRGPYAYKGTDWVGYDDPEIVIKKVCITLPLAPK